MSSVSEEDILNEFILRFSRRLGGIWIPQVPLGLRRFRGVPPKYVADLIRIESHESRVYPRLPLKYWRRALEGDPIYRDINLRNKHILLIEGKVVASYDALGQLLVYKECLVEDWASVEVSMGLVARSFEPWIEETCRRLGILIYRV